MHVCGQTLVLVDNDATVSAVNQKLVRSTLKYLFYHMPENRTFCLNTYTHDIEDAEEYVAEANDLVCTADNLEYEAKDTSLTDTLCEVITRWKDSDFACRDILVFTDGLEGAATGHEKEELYYLVQNCEYPVYIVMLDQEDNTGARKGLSAISVTSGGKFFETEFEGSDAGADRQITEKVFAAMDEYAAANWAEYEETEDDVADEEPSEIFEEDVPAETAGNEPQALTEGKVIYEYDDSPGFFEGPGALVLAAVCIGAGIIVAILGGFIMMKRRRRGYVAPVCRDEEEEYFDDYELKGMSTTELTGDTVFLADDEDPVRPTRLLDDGRIVTLTDEKDAGRCYRIMLKGIMSIGRGGCDVVITGDDALSKRHCELYENGDEVHIRDLSSSNGTRLNRVKIKDERLTDGDRLTIGARTYTVGLA